MCAGAKSDFLDHGPDAWSTWRPTACRCSAMGTGRLPAFYTPRQRRRGRPARQPGPGGRGDAGAMGAGLAPGPVVANPVPAEHAMPRETIDAAITQALAEAQAQGVAGKKPLSPFLLARVSALTGGQPGQQHRADPGQRAAGGAGGGGAPPRPAADTRASAPPPIPPAPEDMPAPAAARAAWAHHRA
ncbi:pseudouridine-5'-phosphate glycosidase [Paucibacter sp. O1-1]|nr:pseudouridine-5'-phosphate glycosidase [Paucibacter sp. O1-1]MDA3824361.1 pseudouridine-5'-phosphate glycosidase [Paucibacter sp. O1-1]